MVLILWLLPEYEYSVIKCEQKQSEQSQFGFKIELRAKINDKESVQVFLQEFYESSHVDFNLILSMVVKIKQIQVKKLFIEAEESAV